MKTRPSGRSVRVAVAAVLLLTAVDLAAAPAGAAPRASATASSAPAFAHDGPDAAALAAPARVPHAELRSVSCTGARFCLAVGAAGAGGRLHPMAEVWNGHRWRVVVTDLPAQPQLRYLDRVACTAPTRCLAVGDSREQWGHPLRWNGRSFVAVPIAGHRLTLGAIRCVRARLCLMIGQTARGGSAIWRYRGARWVRLPVTIRGDVALTDLSCPGPHACLAVGAHFLADGGNRPFLLRWDGHAWTRRVVPGVDRGLFSAVSCVRAFTCTAISEPAGGNAATVPVSVHDLRRGRWTSTTVRVGGLYYVAATALSCTTRRLCTALLAGIGPNDDSAARIAVRGPTGTFRGLGPDYPSLGDLSCRPVGCEIVGDTHADNRGTGTILNQRSTVIAIGQRGRSLTPQHAPSP